MIRRLLLALLVLVLLATGAVGTLVAAIKYYQKPGPLPEAKASNKSEEYVLISFLVKTIWTLGCFCW